MITGTFPGALRNAFSLATSMARAGHEWWHQAAFQIYYYGFSHDIKDLLKSLPVSEETIDKISDVLDQFRLNFLSSSAAKYAGGDHAPRPLGGVLTYYALQAQQLMKSSMDIAIRTGLKSPLMMAGIGGLALLAFGYFYKEKTFKAANDNPEEERKPETPAPYIYYI